MTNPLIPLCRSLDTDRLFRNSDDARKLLRCLNKAYNVNNLGCFVPQYPIWTEGTNYAVGDIVFGRDVGSDGTLYCRHIWECRVAHTATVETQPRNNTTIRWRKIGSTSAMNEWGYYWGIPLVYPPCSILAAGGAQGYGGLNRSPTGVMVSIDGLQPRSLPGPAPEVDWHHDYNGVYCMPLATGSISPGTAYYRGGLCQGDLEWALLFEAGYPNGECYDGETPFVIALQKSTITDNWWHTGFLFCGKTDVQTCSTSYSFENAITKDVPHPYDPQSPEYQAFLQMLRNAPCPRLRYPPEEHPNMSGFGGTVTVLGFTDYMTVGYDAYKVDYFNNGKSARCRWRFALWGPVGEQYSKRLILKNNIACDFFRWDFLGNDWNIFQGNTLIPLTPDENGFFEYIVTVPEGSTISDFGVTNVNALNWKYGGGGDMFGSIWSTL